MDTFNISMINIQSIFPYLFALLLILIFLSAYTPIRAFRKLDNKAYKNSVYAAGGKFPHWVYVKYVGKPVFIKFRKFGVSKFFSMCAANSVGSFFHAMPFIFSSWIKALIVFILSMIICSWIFLYANKKRIIAKNILSKS